MKFLCSDRISRPLFGLLIGLSISMPAIAADKFRIGYFEAGYSSIYDNTWNALKVALAKAGWLDKVEFPADARVSPGRLPEQRKQWVPAARQLMARDDLDMVFSAGTDATSVLLKVNNGKMPIIAGGVSDAVKSKLVTNQDDSGVENFTVRIVPGRYQRMFRIFHDEVGFRKLGLLYVDTENDRKYANVTDAKLVAAERGFEIVSYKIPATRTPEQCMSALESLAASGIDAFYIPSLTCFEWKKYDVKKHLDFLSGKGIPSFARQGSEDVHAGALMGFSTVDYSSRGRFLANMVIKVLEGTSPRALKMVDDAPPKIALNLEVAKILGFDLSFEILGASDEIYSDIVLPEARKVR